MDIETLFFKLCKKAFHWDPPQDVRVRFKHLKRSLANASYDIERGKIFNCRVKVLRKLRFSEKLVAQCLMHEIAHLISGQTAHNNKFYRAYFKGAKTKYGRSFL